MATKTAAKPKVAKATKATTKKAAPTTAEKILAVAKAAGEDGVDIKDLATQTGVSASTATKAVKVLVDEGKVKRDGSTVTAKSRVGRRSAEVVDRDDKILTAIASSAEGLTLEEVAAEVDTTKRLAYESVWRLREQGKVAREGSTRSAKWVAA